MYVPMVPVDRRLHPNAKRDRAPMFPAYVFTRMDAEVDDFHIFRFCPGVIEVIRMTMKDGEKQPTPIDDGFMEELMASENDGVMPTKAEYEKGDRVRVEKGQFTGYEGTIARLRKGGETERVVVLFQTIAGQMPAEMDAADLRPIQ